jgi:hypothetical protein
MRRCSKKNIVIILVAVIDHTKERYSGIETISAVVVLRSRRRRIMVVSEQIIQVLDNLCEKFGLVIDWTSENVVPYMSTLCTKLISYEIWTSVAKMVLIAILSIAVAIATKKLIPTFKRGLEQQKSYEMGWTVASTFAIIGLVFFGGICIGILTSQTMDIIKCVTFPELYIFEYIQDLIKPVS